MAVLSLGSDSSSAKQTPGVGIGGFSSFIVIVNGSDQKGPWLLKAQACPSYGLKPCSVPTLLPAGPAAACGLPDLPVWHLLTEKVEKTPRTGGCKYQRNSTQQQERKVSSQQRLPFNKERKPPMFWGRMQVNLPSSMFGFQYQGKKKESINHNSSTGIKHLML